MEFNYQLIKDEKAFIDVAWPHLVKQSVLLVDTEGDLDIWNGTTVLIQIGVPNEIVYLLDARAFNQFGPLKGILEDGRILKVFQNAKYDYKVLRNLGIFVNNIHDTMLAEQLLTAGVSRRGDFALDALSKKYLDFDLKKYLRQQFIGGPAIITEPMLQYAADDAGVLGPIYEAQTKALKAKGLEQVARLEFDVAPVVAEMELAGILVDIDKWAEFTTWLEEQRQFYATEVYKLAASKMPQMSMFDDTPIINLNSWQQILKMLALFDLHPPNTRAETLQRINHPIANNLVEYKQYQKLVSSFGQTMPGFVNPATGRVHAQFSQIGAASGRFSCRRPNLQQIPIRKTTGFRECFVAPEGYKLITADYSQIEMRIIAELSQDKNLLYAFKSGQDIHRLIASHLFECKISEVTKEQRSLAKNMVYGMSYGLSDKGFARRANITRAKARQLLRTFDKICPTAVRWLSLCEVATVKNRYSKTFPLDRKRWFDIPPYNDKRYKAKIAAIRREGRNHVVQGTSCDMLKTAMVELDKTITDYDAQIVNCIHDELVIEVPEDEVDRTVDAVEYLMVTAGEEFIKSIPVTVDINVGDTWAK